VTGSERKKLIS